jgi:5-methylcytosine-specific restriction endonuclease McrBC GTP-binding regulatory subunit McrB
VEDNGDDEMQNNTNQTQPLNQILYGPPGTGKTYNTINKAIEIIENRVVNDDEKRNDLKKSFEYYKEQGQIEFVTFHQSYGYEEFVEGIKAQTITDDTSCWNGIYCSTSIWSTPKNSVNHAKQLKRIVDKCIYKEDK